MRHERHRSKLASEAACGQKDTAACPSRGATVKDSLTVESLTVELLCSPYSFQSPRHAAVGVTCKHSFSVQISHARPHFAQYEEQRRQLEASQPVSDFDRTVEQIKQLGAPRPQRVRKGKDPADGKELGDGE